MRDPIFKAEIIFRKFRIATTAFAAKMEPSSARRSAEIG